MAAFRWNSSNEVFLPEIDADHRALFRIAEEVRLAMKSTGETARTMSGLRALLSESEAHFSREERLMTESGFWGFGWHKGQHDTARKQLRKTMRAQEKGDQPKAERELKSLLSWLNDHTSIADRILGAYLRNQGRLADSGRTSPAA